jgi:hypothetical protein
MSDEWKEPLRESLHHLTLAILFLTMLAYDFAPVALMTGLMGASERLLHDRNYHFLGVPLEDILNHIEVFLLLSFVLYGAFKVLSRLGQSVVEVVREMIRKAKTP